jgi:ribosomal protein S18 acetylase RimI-like enzyme
MKLVRFVYLFITWFIVSQHATATCSAIFEHMEPIITYPSKGLGKILVYSIPATHNCLDKIINRVLILQKSLLINKKLLHEIVQTDIQDGFLIGEFNASTLKSSLIQEQGVIITACMQDQINPEEQLIGYAIIRSTDYFEDVHKNNDVGVLNLSISKYEWNNFISNLRYIHQIAVHPNFRRNGIGKMLLKTCQKECPKGLLADVLYWPKPFVNQLSYRLFLKSSFRDVGDLYIKDFPAFRPCKTHVMVWKPVPVELSDI